MGYFTTLLGSLWGRPCYDLYHCHLYGYKMDANMITTWPSITCATKCYYSWEVLIWQCVIINIIGASLSEFHTGNNWFNHGTRVVFPKVYPTNTESPTLLVSLFNRGMSVAFPKVYVSTMEGFVHRYYTVTGLETVTSLQVHAMHLGRTIRVSYFPPFRSAVTKLFSFQLRVTYILLHSVLRLH